MHEVLVNRLGGLSLPRKSVVRLTDRPDMTLEVYRGRKTTIQQQQQHVAIKAGLYRKAVQVYDIPNLYPVTLNKSYFYAENPQTDLKGKNRGFPKQYIMPSDVKTTNLPVQSSCFYRYLSHVAQSVGHRTRKSGVLGSIPGLATYFRFSFRFFKKAVVSYWQKYVHEVLVNRLGGLSLTRKSVVRSTDRPDMTLDVYRGRKTTMQQQQIPESMQNVGFNLPYKAAIQRVDKTLVKS